jgi:hypothetical protein
LRGPEGIGNVGRLDIDVALVHLHRAVPVRLHGHAYGNSSARPFGEGGVSQVVKDELFNAGCLDRLFDVRAEHIRRDRRAVRPGEHELVDVRNYAPLSSSALISWRISRALSVNGETCSTLVFFLPPSGVAREDGMTDP